MRKLLPVALALMLLAAAHATWTQATADAGQKNAQQARAALDAMVQALGGPAWLNMKNQMRQGFVAAFDHGKPEPGTTKYWEFHAWPDHDRIEYTAHRDGDGALEDMWRYSQDAADMDWLGNADHDNGFGQCADQAGLRGGSAHVSPVYGTNADHRLH